MTLHGAFPIYNGTLSTFVIFLFLYRKTDYFQLWVLFIRDGLFMKHTMMAIDRIKDRYKTMSFSCLLREVERVPM